MKTTLTIILLGSLSLFAIACGDDDGGSADAAPMNDAAATPDAPTPDAAGPPAKPALGMQLERMGRPAINTALNHAFDANAGTAGMGKDGYNAAAPANWATFAPEFAKNLAIIDSLDTNCGNQLLADPTMPASRYNLLAGVLCDDELYVNSNGMTCSAYLAVEANATGILPNNDCGGRTLTYDVIDTSYSVLAAGVLAGVGDNIAKDEDTAIHDNNAFPFVGAPQ